MSKKVLLFVLASVLMPFCISAQDYAVKGSVWDFDTAEPICSVAVSVYQITGNDTTFYGGCSTDDNGSFIIGQLKAGNWRIPTKDELEELRTKCTWTSTTLNGVKGYSVTSNVDGYTDRFIFLPATGMRIRQWTLSTDTIGRFWGNSIEIDDDSDDAVYLNFNFSRGPGRFSIVRCFGQCVRPVCP